MNDFFRALSDYAFLQNALLAGVLASVGCGITGTYVVVKRLGLLAGGVAHAVLGGMGAAYFYGINPLIGAIAAAIVSALIIGWVTLRWQQKEDTVIAALWSIGMAIGIVFISRTPGYNVDLMSYLFGNVLLVSRADIYTIATLDALILAGVALFYKQLLAVAFDEEFARLRGLRVELYYMLMLIMIALTVVTLIQIVGLILVIALLTLPAAIAGQFSHSLRLIMVAAVFLGMLFTTAGLAAAYVGDLPAGATIILIAGAAYLVSLGASRLLSAR